jgi:predicted nuclease of predicted toxin-antitoxin system
VKLLLDQDVYAATARFLRGEGHDCLTAAEGGLSQASDSDLMVAAQREGRILVTRDRDFGGLVFVQQLGSGVIYLRLTPASLYAVHSELAKVLTNYTEDQLHNAFVVVEVGRHRFRRLRA